MVEGGDLVYRPLPAADRGGEEQIVPGHALPGDLKRVRSSGALQSEEETFSAERSGTFPTPSGGPETTWGEESRLLFKNAGS